MFPMLIDTNLIFKKINNEDELKSAILGFKEAEYCVNNIIYLGEVDGFHKFSVYSEDYEHILPNYRETLVDFLKKNMKKNVEEIV